MSGPVSGADPEDIEMIAAGLRADRADVASLARVLSSTLGKALPPGMVEVDRTRTLGDRLAGREGVARSITVRGDDRELSLRESAHGPVAEVRQVVRGVVLNRRSVGLDEWLRVLADELARLAARDAAARDALSRLLR